MRRTSTSTAGRTACSIISPLSLNFFPLVRVETMRDTYSPVRPETPSKDAFPPPRPETEMLPPSAPLGPALPHVATTLATAWVPVGNP